MPHISSLQHSSWGACRQLCNAAAAHVLLFSGELEVAAEYNATDSDAVGSVDFVIFKNHFVISVWEVSGSSCCSS